MKTTLQVLIDARALIEKPKAWIKGVNATNKLGKGCTSSSEDAVCWCMDGALMRSAQSAHLYEPGSAYWDAFYALNKLANGDFIAWNDKPERKHAEVLAVFDKAIEAERAKQPAEALE